MLAWRKCITASKPLWNMYCKRPGDDMQPTLHCCSTSSSLSNKHVNTTIYWISVQPDESNLTLYFSLHLSAIIKLFVHIFPVIRSLVYWFNKYCAYLTKSKNRSIIPQYLTLNQPSHKQCYSNITQTLISNTVRIKIIEKALYNRSKQKSVIKVYI